MKLQTPLHPITSVAKKTKITLGSKRAKQWTLIKSLMKYVDMFIFRFYNSTSKCFNATL